MGNGFTTTTSAAASSMSGLAAALGVSTERVFEVSASFTSNSVSPKYTPEQLVTNQLYEIIKERES